MRIGPFNFAPRLWPSLATLFLMPVLLYLGGWQLGRGDEKEALHQQFEERMRATPTKLSPAMLDGLDDSRYRNVRVRGQYLVNHQFLLDNRTSSGQVGVEVFTPFDLGNGQPLVLVNRGWLPWGSLDRRSLPEVHDLPTIPPKSIEGLVSIPPRPGLLLGEAGYHTQTWPRLVQLIDIEQVQIALGRPVSKAILLLSDEQPNGYHRQWSAYSGITPDRHRGYALQWYSLAFALLVIYIVVNTSRIRPSPSTIKP